MTDSSHLAAWVALSLLRHVGGKTMRNLVMHFGNVHAILQADKTTLRKVPGIGPKIADAIIRIRLDDVERSIRAWQHHGVQIITMNDPLYPDNLRQLDDAPPTLFALSTYPFDLSHERKVAVIGTRQPSKDALSLTMDLAYELSDYGVGTVSGLAYGVDIHAHVGGAASPYWWPIAVLGSGVLNVYPPEHRKFIDPICAAGVCFCEVAPNAAVSASGLVARNRIITGLSDAVVIIETSIDGGAMHAARFATQQKRPIYVYDTDASGNKHLIEQGAQSFSTVEEVMQLLFPKTG